MHLQMRLFGSIVLLAVFGCSNDSSTQKGDKSNMELRSQTFNSDASAIPVRQPPESTQTSPGPASEIMSAAAMATSNTCYGNFLLKDRNSETYQPPEDFILPTTLNIKKTPTAAVSIRSYPAGTLVRIYKESLIRTTQGGFDTQLVSARFLNQGADYDAWVLSDNPGSMPQNVWAPNTACAGGCNRDFFFPHTDYPYFIRLIPNIINGFQELWAFPNPAITETILPGFYRMYFSETIGKVSRRCPNIPSPGINRAFDYFLVCPMALERYPHCALDKGSNFF